MKIFKMLIVGLTAASLLLVPNMAFGKLPDNPIVQTQDSPIFYYKSPEKSDWEVFGAAEKGKNTVYDKL